jgi:hypothetical protein
MVRANYSPSPYGAVGDKVHPMIKPSLLMVHSNGDALEPLRSHAYARRAYPEVKIQRTNIGMRMNQGSPGAPGHQTLEPPLRASVGTDG